MSASHRYPLLVAMLCVLSLAGCRSLASGPEAEVLPPPPRANIVLPGGTMTDTLGAIPRPGGTDIEAPPARMDTGAVPVLDAATLEVMPFERRVLGPRSPSHEEATPGDPPTTTEREGEYTFRARFEGGVRTAGSAGGHARQGQEDARDIEVNRDSLWEATTPWSELEVVRDSMEVRIPWSKLYSHLSAGRRLYVRGLVWPSPAGVVTRQTAEIRIATNWIPARRLSQREVRCVSGQDRSAGDVRLLATLVPAEGADALMETRMEVRNLGSCAISRRGIDRVAAFKYDVWNAVNRATTLGTRFYLNPGGLQRP